MVRPIVIGLLIGGLLAGWLWFRAEREHRAPSPAPVQRADDQTRLASSADESAIPNHPKDPGEESSDAPPSPTVQEISLASFDPLDLYQAYIEPANAGDIDAQLILEKALGVCKDTADNRAAHDAMLRRMHFDEQTVDYLNRLFNTCQPLHRQIDDVRAEHKRWMTAVLGSQHPLIEVQQRSLPDEERRNLILNAISTDYPERMLYADAFIEASAYYDEEQHQDNYRREAWMLLYCEVAVGCDSAAEREHLRTWKYLPWEYEEITSIETDLREAIARRDWEALGFG